MEGAWGEARKTESAPQPPKGERDKFRGNEGTRVSAEDAVLEFDINQNKSCKQRETEVVDKWNCMPEQPGISFKIIKRKQKPKLTQKPK